MSRKSEFCETVGIFAKEIKAIYSKAYLRFQIL
jgi:hypothetical protein